MSEPEKLYEAVEAFPHPDGLGWTVVSHQHGGTWLWEPMLDQGQAEWAADSMNKGYPVTADLLRQHRTVERTPGQQRRHDRMAHPELTSQRLGDYSHRTDSLGEGIHRINTEGLDAELARLETDMHLRRRPREDRS